MRTLAILGATAALATSLAFPATAREMKGGHHRHMAKPAMQQQDANAGWNTGWTNNNWNTGWDRRENTGFWPADLAAGAVGTAGAVAGAAIGTAGAIATAPFRTADAYAYDPQTPALARPWSGQQTYDRGQNGYYGDWNSYATRNGLVCRPGTMFKGADGLMHPCQ